MKKFFPMLILLVLIVLAITGCSQANQATATSAPNSASSDGASPTSASALDGQTLLEARCTTCHSLARVASAKGDAAQWQQVVDQMVQKGAQLNADEEKVLVEYLAANFK